MWGDVSTAEAEAVSLTYGSSCALLLLFPPSVWLWSYFIERKILNEEHFFFLTEETLILRLYT